MKKFILISVLVALSNCDFERDLADCTNAGRCTNSTGGGTGITGGGTGITGGGTGITGGGTGFTGGGTPLRTDCPTLTDVAFTPTSYTYYSSGGWEFTESRYRTDSGTVLDTHIDWSSEDAGTGVAGNTISERLDGGYNQSRRITLSSDSKDYELLSGVLTLNTSRSSYGSMSGTISAGYFYNSANLDECFFAASLSFDTETSVTCEPLTAGCFASGSVNFYDDGTFTSTTAYASCTNRMLFMQIAWQESGADNGVSMPHVYDLTEPPRFFPVQTYIQQTEPDGGGSTVLFGETGTFHLSNASRDAGGVFQADIANVLFYNRQSGIRTECLSLTSQTYDFTY